MNTQIYERPQIDIISFEATEIITTSGDLGDNETPDLPI